MLKLSNKLILVLMIGVLFSAQSTKAGASLSPEGDKVCYSADDLKAIATYSKDCEKKELDLRYVENSYKQCLDNACVPKWFEDPRFIGFLTFTLTILACQMPDHGCKL